MRCLDLSFLAENPEPTNKKTRLAAGVFVTDQGLE
jgi:hypothetical protein